MMKPIKHARPDRAEAFLPDPEDGPVLTSPVGDDTESFAEEFIASITGGEFVLEDARNEETDEEVEDLRNGVWSTPPDALEEETKDA